MKPFITVLTIMLSLHFIAACIFPTNDALSISKLFTSANAMNDNIIELYNNSATDVDLSNYAIYIYSNGSTDVTHTIKLSSILDANSYYAIGCENHSNSGVVNKLDFKRSEYLAFNGNDVIALVKNKAVIDVIGTIGFDVDFSKNITLIKLGERSGYQPSTTYNTFDYISYLPDAFKYLKNDDHEIKTLEQIYEGPRLEQRYYDLPFTVDAVGGGGVIEVAFNANQNADGDTAFFTSLDNSYSFSGRSNRYFYINTPEVESKYVNHQPWGYVASKFNKEYLLNQASLIQVQSLKGYSITETNSRNLGLVWVDGQLAQFLIVAEGLSQRISYSFNHYDLEMNYKNVPYLTFMQFAEERAIQNGWGVFGYPFNDDGEKAPDWNYNTNATATINPVWTPHLPIN